MIPRAWRGGAWVPAPLLVGLALAMVGWRGWLPNPVVSLRADVGTLMALLGIGLAGVMALAWVQRGRQRRALAALQAAAAEDHRRFLRRLDHELKNPLTAMRAALANLTLNGTTPAQICLLESVEREALRIGRLAADLRKLADVETGALDLAEVEMATLLREVVAAVQEQEEYRGRTVMLALPAAPWPLPPVQGDPDLIFAAFHNLLANALKFSQPGDTVEVRAADQGSAVVIEVADTGSGIPADELPHIWEELYRGQGARGTPGSGVGLALVRAIIERHQGQVAVRSRAGQGTVFTVRLPAR